MEAENEASDAIESDAIEILIVEDSPTQALKLQFILEDKGYRVTVARNGRDGLATLRKRLPDPLPTMVITDIEMPYMTGYELCQSIKDDAALRQLPVMLLTSLSDPKDVVKGIECRADNFVVKPYDEQFLLSRVNYILANQKLRAQSILSGGAASDEGRSGGIEVFFAGQKHVLSATPGIQTTLDLLLGTYETAIQKNLELSEAKEALEKQADELARSNAELAQTSDELRATNQHMQSDLDLARDIQNGFILKQYPSFPHHVAPHQSALRFYHRWIPTTTLGGDFFDVLALSETQAGVFICDVMGHGVRSALVTAMLRALVGERTSEALDPGQFLGEINRHLIAILQQTRTPMFALAFYMIADLETGQLSYANAGHPSPLLVRHAEGEGQRTVEWLMPEGSASGPALGVFEDATYEAERRDMAVGDLLMLFTDGLVEVEGPPGEYGEDRLQQNVQQSASLSPSALFDHLLAEIRSFSGQGDFDDDVCLVGMEVACLQPGA